MSEAMQSASDESTTDLMHALATAEIDCANIRAETRTDGAIRKWDEIQFETCRFAPRFGEIEQMAAEHGFMIVEVRNTTDTEITVVLSND